MLGGILTIFGIIAVVMIHEAGHLIPAKVFGMKVTEYFLGFGPKIWSFRRGETEYGVKAIPAGGYVRIIGMNPIEEVAAEEEHRTYRGKPFWQKSIVVMGGIASHFVIAFILLWIVAVVVGTPDADVVLPRVSQITAQLDDGSQSAAVDAGIEPGDVIVSIDAVSVEVWDDMSTLLQERAGEEIVIGIERGGVVISATTTLTCRNTETGLTRSCPTVLSDNGDLSGFLGVSPTFDTTRDNPIKGLVSAGSDTASLTEDSLRGIWAFGANFTDFLKGVFTEEELTDDVRPVSVVGIAQLGAAGQREGGIGFTLQLIAFFSVFVGILNAIPIYPFDGGHFSVALYEKIRGRHPDVRKLLPVAAFVFLLLLLVGLVTVFLDITNPLDFG